MRVLLLGWASLLTGAASAFGTWRSPDDRASFGPLEPSVRPVAREYLWPEGRMPDAQPQQVAAKSSEKAAPGFDAAQFRRPYLDFPLRRASAAVGRVFEGRIDCNLQRRKAYRRAI